MKRPQFSLRAKYRSTEIPFRSFGANLLQVTGRALSCLSILMIGDSELGWRGASLTAYCLLLLLPALILMRRGPKILGPAWALFVGLSPAILLSAFSARMYMVYMLFCTLAIVLSVFWRPMKWDRKGFLYLLASLAASFRVAFLGSVNPSPSGEGMQ